MASIINTTYPSTLITTNIICSNHLTYLILILTYHLHLRQLASTGTTLYFSSTSGTETAPGAGTGNASDTNIITDAILDHLVSFGAESFFCWSAIGVCLCVCMCACVCVLCVCASFTKPKHKSSHKP